MRPDLKHLKWRLINKDGLSPDEAQKRIDEVIKYENMIKEEKWQEKL